MVGCSDSKQAYMKFEDRSFQVNGNDMEEGHTCSSSILSSDDEFNRNANVVSKLLKRAKEYIMNQADKKEQMVYCTNLQVCFT